MANGKPRSSRRFCNLLALNSGTGAARKRFRLLGRPLEQLRHWTRRNSRAQARENIAAHYDLGNVLCPFSGQGVALFSALFAWEEQDPDDAQRAKMARLCEQLALNPSDHLLRLGTGWGRWRNTRPVTTAAG